MILRRFFLPPFMGEVPAKPGMGAAALHYVLAFRFP